MSAEEFDSWQETIEVMHDFPDLGKDIEKAEREYKKGNYLTLEDILAQEGFVLAAKTKKTNVSRHFIEKRQRRFR